MHYKVKEKSDKQRYTYHMAKDPFDEKTDHELVELSKKQRDVFAYIIKRYDEKLTRYIHRLAMLSKEEREDILQDVFIQVYKHLYYVDATLSFSSWIYRVTHNMVISSLRKKRARPSIVSWDEQESLLNKLCSEEDIHLSLQKKEQKENLYAYIDTLDDKYKDIILLYYIEEKTYEEISDILKLPSGTIATRLYRAKKKIQKNFNI